MMTLKQAHERFLEEKAPVVSADHLSNLRMACQDQEDIAGADTPLSEVTRQHVREVMLSRHRAGQNGAAYRRKLDLRVLWRFVGPNGEGWCDHDPYPWNDPRIEGLRMPKRQVVHGVKPGDWTIHNVLAVLSPSHRWIEFAIRCGLRRDMARLLRWEWVDPQFRYIEFPARARGLKDQAGNGWLLPLCDSAAAILREIGHQGDGLVFARRNHKTGEWGPPNASPDKRTVEKRLAKSGRVSAEWRLHDFRTSFGTFAQGRRDESGQPAYPRDVIELALGHVNPDQYTLADFYDHRLELQADWNAFLDQPVDGA
jgi:integrase